MASGAIDQVVTRLEKAVQHHKFDVLNIIDLKAKMASKDVVFGPGCRGYAARNPHRAERGLEENLRVTPALPFRIALCQVGNQVKSSTPSTVQ